VEDGVLIISGPSDPHATCVRTLLDAARIRTAQFDLSRAGKEAVDVVPGSHVIVGKDRIVGGWTVWWRRAAATAPSPWAGETRLDANEAALAEAELRDILLGGLLSLELRWVDDPYAVLKAEQKLLQLAVAKECLATTPLTRATNQIAYGQALLADGPLIAKAISSGPGIAPYAGSVDAGMLERLPEAPTVLQRQVAAVADLRAVVVGEEVFCWRRARDLSDIVDWREADPGGRSFVPAPSRQLRRIAPALNSRLGLTVGIQDWLEGPDGTLTFLEVNPCGSWMFLDGAETRVGSALAQHLVEPTYGTAAVV
jgi:hypothetical protein